MATDTKRTLNETSVLTFRVKEARSQDVGRGIARLDPIQMEKLDLSVGDIVELEGKRRTVAKIMPTYPEDRGHGILQIDGLVRENAKSGIDEKIRIKKVDWKPADKIVLTPLTLMRAFSGDDRYLGSLLTGLPLVEGDRLRAHLIGAQAREFQVAATFPKGIVVIQASTKVELQSRKTSEPEKAAKISYEDIGGLGPQIQRIREMIELPLRHPEVFERLGIQPPKGVLLYGPPGTGKTLIARAVANETEAYFTSISGPEIMGKFYGESEGRLRGVFEEAKEHTPSILFIDEIDAIAPKREEMGGEKQVEKRVVAQLLALMDGLESRGQLIVIAATNLPNSLDPALRRPGRFDREITIPIPDRKSRLEILQIHTRGMPLAKDVDLEKLAAITHGFVGADLAALAREAAMACLRGLLPSINFDLSEIPYETLMKLEVTHEHFLSALREVEPSAIREVFVETPDVTWEDIGGLEEMKEELKQAVEWPLKHEALFTQAKARPPKGILFHGAPGTGKTLLAKALAHESQVNFISVKGPELISKYIGESERGVREVFKKAKQVAPTILFFDEIDSLVPRRGTGDSSMVTERVISQFLTEMDGLEELKGVLVLAATNRMDLVDPALLRPGRFDLILKMPLPDLKARQAIFKVHLKGKPLAEDVDVSFLAKETHEGVSGAQIENLCRLATMEAIRECIELQKGEPKKLKIQKKHFERVMNAENTLH